MGPVRPPDGAVERGAPGRRTELLRVFGVRTEVVELQSGATANQTLTGGSIQPNWLGPDRGCSGVPQGVDLVSILTTISMTLQMCVRRGNALDEGVRRRPDPGAGRQVVDRPGFVAGGAQAPTTTHSERARSERTRLAGTIRPVFGFSSEGTFSIRTNSRPKSPSTSTSWVL